MENLIKALQIFLKYGNPDYPTYCRHDELVVCIDPKLVSEEDKNTLEKLGFIEDEDGYFVSYRYGSC
jgi:hypothetical protein